MQDHEQSIKKFWDDQAHEWEGRQQATNEDTWYRSLEIKQIIKALGKNPGYVLDVGCGNGYSTKKFAASFPSGFFTGIDFSEDMITEARKGRPTNAFFRKENVLDLQRMNLEYNIVISERCLINLTSFEQQKQAMLNLKQLLVQGGKMLIVENTIDGLNRLNKTRNRLGLHSIQVRWHNLYLPHDAFLAFLKEHFEFVKDCNIGTPYYPLSRIVYAKYAQMRGIEPDYNNWMNRIACRIPPITSWWASPNHMFICSGKKP